MADIALSGSGTISVATTIDITPTVRLEVLDDELTRAPTVVTVRLTGAVPDTDVDFYIDGNLVLTQETDSEGGLYVVPLEVDDTHAAGSHTVTAVQSGATTGSATFTLLKAPVASESSVGNDTDPVAVPGALQSAGYYRWVLQDLLPGGLGSYILPRNPDSWTSPEFERTLTARHTVAEDGQFHLSEGQEVVAEWSFEGFCPTEEMHDKLVAFHGLNRRFYVIDHRNRAWNATFVDVSMSPRTRRVIDGVLSDWGHDYTVSAVAYSQTPGVPA